MTILHFYECRDCKDVVCQMVVQGVRYPKRCVDIGVPCTWTEVETRGVSDDVD